MDRFRWAFPGKLIISFVLFFLIVSCGSVDTKDLNQTDTSPFGLQPSVTDNRTAILVPEETITIQELKSTPTIKITPLPNANREYRIWETSGTSVIYKYEGYYCLWNFRDDPIPLTYTRYVGMPKLSPDGNKVAYAVVDYDEDNPKSELWVINSDGTNPRLLINTSKMFALHDAPIYDEIFYLPYQIEWLNDSENIIFNSTWPQGAWLGLYDDLYVVNINTKILSALYKPGGGGQIRISPDGNFAALVAPEYVNLINLRNWKQFAYVENSLARPAYHYLHYPRTIWADNSEYLMFAMPYTYLDEGGFPIKDAQLYVWKITADGSPPEVTAVFDLGFGEMNDWFYGSALSPDLTKVLYNFFNQENNQWELHLAAVDGSWDEIYYAQSEKEEFHFSWLNDSEHFTFSVKDGGKWKKVIGKLGELPQPYEPVPLTPTTIEISNYAECIPAGPPPKTP